MATRLAQRIGDAQPFILSSTAQRARATAAAIAHALPSPGAISFDSDLYLASPGTLLALLARQESALPMLIAIGHNPGMTQLANLLLPTLHLDNLPTAGVVSLQLPIADWAEIGTAPGSLDDLDYPKKSRR